MSGTKIFFTYRSDELYCDATSVCQIAEAVGTPVYVYSSRRIAGRFEEFDRATTGDASGFGSRGTAALRSEPRGVRPARKGVWIPDVRIAGIDPHRHGP